MKTALLAAALIALGAPAFASSEAPVTGPARPLVAPMQIAQGSDAAPMFGTMEVLVRGDAGAVLALSAEAYLSPRG